MAERLKDKVAVVTGAGSIGPGWGNGKATAVLFAREGAKVVCIDVNLDAAEETASIIRAEGGNALTVKADVSSAAEVDRAIEAAMERYGRIDILHNNVGIARLTPIEQITEEEWDRVLAINLKSLMLTCRRALPVMVAQGKGAIVNIASIAGIRDSGVPYITYSTTKGAILAFTRTIALQYAKKGIRANCVLPGLMNTPLLYAGLQSAYSKTADSDEMVRRRDAQCPMGHMGDAWDVAHAALYLASDEAKYVTAAELVVDGGITAKFA
ncbi:MAG: SDR family oxidoreductase [Alphaproteobacteria bacterium]|nr:SDR family oxidoreductase [Alphaproteobacteria bacterium]